MHRRKKCRIFLVLLWALFSAHANFAQKTQEDKNEEKEEVFVFPSMQMEGISAAREKDSMPIVEVIYRGQPPIEHVQTSTTMSSSEVITSTTAKTTGDNGGTWTFNTMNNPDNVFATTTKVPDLSGKNHVTWNPDSIDVTMNPNKGRKTKYGRPTENPLKDYSTSSESIDVSTSAPNNVHSTIPPGLKDAVLKSSDYEKWSKMKKSFLFEPAESTKATVSNSPLKSSDDDEDQLLAGSQAPELEIQHELSHFPSFPIETTKRVPREYLTKHTDGGVSYQVSSTSAHGSTEGPPILFTLTPDLQDQIPDGYELIPVDQLTNEYEIVPWNQVQTLLNVSIVYPDEAEEKLSHYDPYPEFKPLPPTNYPKTTYAPPTTPHMDHGYSKAKYLPAYHNNDGESSHHHQGEGLKTWFTPPPISPDLPTLYYDDTDEIKQKIPTTKKHNPPKKPVKSHGLYDPRQPKHNLFKHANTNVIHFGTDFGTTPRSPDINGYKVSTLPTPPAFIRNIFYNTYGPSASTLNPHKSTTPKYVSSTTPYSKVKYSTPAPTTVKSLPALSYTSTFAPLKFTNHPSPTYAPPIIVSTTANPYAVKAPRKHHEVKDLTVPVIRFEDSPSSIAYSTAAPDLDPQPVNHFESKSYSLFNFYTTPRPVYHPEEHSDHLKAHVKPYKPPSFQAKPHHEDHHIEIKHEIAHHHSTPQPPNEYLAPEHQHHPHPSKYPPSEYHLILDEHHVKEYDLTPEYKPPHEHHSSEYEQYSPPEYKPPHEHYSPPEYSPPSKHHPPPEYHPQKHIPDYNPPAYSPEYHPPQEHYQYVPKYHTDHYYPEVHEPYPPIYKPEVTLHGLKDPHHQQHQHHHHHPSYHSSQPHEDEIHGLPPKGQIYNPLGSHKHHGHHLKIDPYLANTTDVSHLPPKIKSFLPVGFHSVYNGLGLPPKYPPIPLGHPPSYPPQPYLLGLNRTANRNETKGGEKIKIDNVESLREALRKAGVGPGSSKKVYLVREDDGETHVQISVPIQELFGAEEIDDDFEERKSEAKDTSLKLTETSTTQAPTTTEQETTEATTKTTTETTTKTTTETIPPTESVVFSTTTSKPSPIKFEMNDFWLQMQKLFKPGQILMADSEGTKLTNILISKEVEDGLEEALEAEESQKIPGLKMNLSKVGSSLDLASLSRGEPAPKENLPQIAPAMTEEMVMKRKKLLASLGRSTTAPPDDKKLLSQILNAVPTNRIFVPENRFKFGHENSEENVHIVTPLPNPVPTTSSSNEVLESLRNTLDGLVSSVQGLNSTMMAAMKEKTESIKKKEPDDQIRSLQMEIASLTKTVQDLRSQKQSQEFMTMLLETQKAILEATTIPPTTAATTSTATYNWFTSEPTTTTTTTTTTTKTTTTKTTTDQNQFLSYDDLDTNGVDIGLFNAADQDDGNSINLGSAATEVENQQEAFLRLTNPGVNFKQPPQQIQSSAPPSLNTFSNDIFPATLVGSSLSFSGQDNNRLPPGNAGFGSVEPVELGTVNLQVGNQVLVQNQNLDELPSYGGYQSSNIDQNDRPTFNTVTSGSGGLPNYGQNNAGSVSVQVSTTSLPNYASNNQVPTSFPNYASNNQVSTSLPNYGSSQAFPVTSFPSYGNSQVSTSLPNYGNSPFQQTFQGQQNIQALSFDDLPSYGGGQQSGFLNNQPAQSQFQASSPLNSVQQLTPNNQPWVGATNHQQLLLQNQQHLTQLNSQTQFQTQNPTLFPHSNERPVRFPGDASNRYDPAFDEEMYYDLPYEHYSPEASQQKEAYYGHTNYNPSTPPPNIVAELAKYSSKKNLIYRPNYSTDPYIQYPSSYEMQEPDKHELIMYPSGQLIMGANNVYPSTMGPYLRSHLAQSYQHGQKPHYVVARKKDLYDPLLEGDEDVIERSDTGAITGKEPSSEGGILPMILRTAKDDLKLVGDVIKMALS